MWSHHTDGGNAYLGGHNIKNIYLGETRIVTKLAAGIEETVHEEFYKQFYYHSDHLGSANLITDYRGDEYQRLEYTPYGEIWIDKYSQIQESTALLPYKFTGKERDEETGLYYYGARYLDAKYSRWLSCDPALSYYVEGKSNGSSGGIYNSINLNLYHYAGNNPIKYIDPDGREEDVYAELKPYVPAEPKRQVDSASGSLVPSANYTQHTGNQNKEQKALWGEATFVDGPGENSCYMQTGLYSVSSELNNSPKNSHIYAQGQLDILNVDFSASATDGGGGVGFSANGIAVSGKIGYQSEKVLATIGGSAGFSTGGEVKFDIDEGVFIFDVAFILGVRIEVNWKRDKE